MVSLRTFESQICALMETVVKGAVTELSSLLDKYSSNFEAEQRRSSPATTTATTVNDRGVTPPEFNEAVANQFASLMEAWARDAVEKILMMFKVFMFEVEDGPVAEPSAQPRDNGEQTSMKPKSGQGAGQNNRSASRGSHKKKKKTEGGIEQAMRTDHMYYREEEHTEEVVAAAAESESATEPADEVIHETTCGSPSESAATLTEPSSALVSHISSADVDTSNIKSKMKKKKTSGPFQCPTCDKSFALKCLLDRHYLTHSKPHLCSECGKRFAGPQALIAHSRRHTGEKLYKCSDCGTEFAYKYTLRRHMRLHSLTKPLTHMCMLCESQFTGLQALQRHRCYALKKTFVCSLCPETFECRLSLADHENLHSGDRDFVCEMCGESFFSSSSLATHRVTHMQKELCWDGLGMGSSDLSVLKTHMSKHTGEKLFSCEVCGKACSHRSALKHHMLTHTGERPYICETCGKRCGHASALQNHLRIHTGKKPGQQPVCTVCGKKFRRTVNLNYHMSIHTGVKPYACDQCDKKFSNPSNLKLHTMIHSGEKMYGCNICGRRFTRCRGLKLHRRIHTGEQPYRCMVCEQGFMYSSELKKHGRSHLPVGDGPSEKTAVITEQMSRL